MSTSAITPLCGHCGRPVISAIWLGGVPYHYECTQSPYATHNNSAVANPPKPKEPENEA